MRNHFVKNVFPGELEEKSRIISQAVVKCDFYLNSKVIMVYMPLADEVNITEIIEDSFKTGKKIVTPKCDRENCLIMPVQIECLKKDLSKGFAGILEPNGETVIEQEKIDLIIVPGRAFDETGGRLGRGKGYYDRFLQTNTNSIKVGVAFEFQVVKDLKICTHDVRMDYLVTESRLLTFKHLN